MHFDKKLPKKYLVYISGYIPLGGLKNGCQKLHKQQQVSLENNLLLFKVVQFVQNKYPNLLVLKFSLVEIINFLQPRVEEVRMKDQRKNLDKGSATEKNADLIWLSSMRG